MSRMAWTVLGWVAIGAAGCAADPALDAWHGAIRVDSVLRADGACDAEPAEVEPDEPYLFVAVERGYPDVTSLYWCSDPKTCTTPFDTSALTSLTETTLTADLAAAEPFAGLCTLRWNDVVASQDASGRVSLTYRTGLTEEELPEQDCIALVDTAIGGVCDAVLTISGVRE